MNTANRNGFLFGLLCPGVLRAKKEPVAYLYNGVRLPDINEVWTDKETYPYAFISSVSGYPYDAPYYVLYLCNGYGLVDDPESDYMGLGLDDLLEYHLVPTWGSTWRLYEDWSSTATYTHLVDWSSVDVVGEDGTVYITASEPIPVYE